MVEPIAAARAVSSPVVLVVQSDIPHELRTYFKYIHYNLQLRLYVKQLAKMAIRKNVLFCCCIFEPKKKIKTNMTTTH